MIRRNLYYVERDTRVVKWALIAALFALSVGMFAETTLVRRDVDGTAVAGQSVKVRTEVSSQAAG